MNTTGSPVDHFCTVADGMRLCYRVDGQALDSPLVLIAGLGIDLTSWPHAMINGLTARGFYVIRLDNRDAGRSSRARTPTPNTVQLLSGHARRDGYDLGTMAADTVALLDWLGAGLAHVVGMSMGGMIAQTIAARFPERTRSLTSIFSTTGASNVGQPTLSTRIRLALPEPRTQRQAISRHLMLLRHIGGRGIPFDETAAARYAAQAWLRAGEHSDRAAKARQINAIFASADRTEELRRITAPTLVIHGDHDVMVDPSGGRATAAAINEARLVTVPGMGHDLAPRVVDRVIDEIAELAKSADTSR